MKAPDNIYINDSAMNDPTEDPWHEARPHRSNEGQARYIRFDLHEAALAELRREVERLKDLLEWEQIANEAATNYALAEEKENDQLRARLDAAMEWQDSAGFNCTENEKIIFWSNKKESWGTSFAEVGKHIPENWNKLLSIKPPKAPGEV